MVSNSYKIYFNEISDFQILSKEREDELCAFPRTLEAKEELIKAHLKLAVKIAAKFGSLGLEIEDLISEGNLGLSVAAERFQLGRGSRFSSYACFWIKQKSCKALCEKSRLIRIPNGSMQGFLKILDFIEKHKEEHGINPTLEAMAKHSRMSVRRVKNLFASTDAPISIHSSSMGDSERREMGEFIEDARLKHVSDVMIDKENQEIIEKVLDSLNERERFVVVRRFGLENHTEETLMEIGKKMRLSRERVRQIESAALIKMKKIIKLY